MKRLLLCVLLFQLVGCTELQQVVNQLPQGTVGNAEIAQALKEALNQGIEKQVNKLASMDGFFKNELVKILLPEELKKVDKALRDVGLGNLADEGLRVINRAAEDAVDKSIPIFVDAVKGISFEDARKILLGADNAATSFLESSTSTKLYNKFNPVIEQSFKKVGADEIWRNIITKYNGLPLTTDVNPDLTDYTTKEALEGVYTMIALEEKKIRTNISSRTTELLKKVFALQD
ncbi:MULTISPECIES: DUF4197 domain-containing protein [Pseudomonadati]|uniref:DUF4197 domain-containing protein n=1 Tax=Pseudomonadati TaxID=3379134 RepID=UPI003BAB04C8